MKNPLSRRLLRELRQDIGKYIALFLFLMLTTGFISGFLVADGSMVRAYDESFEKYNIESGHFILEDKLPDETKAKLEAAGVSVYELFYKEATLDNENTVRIFKNRSEVNKTDVLEGRLPESKGEIAADRLYLENNGLTIGDELAGLKITGAVALSDYSALFKNNTDMMLDANKFCVAVVTPETFDEIDENVHLCYAWLNNDKTLSDEQCRDKADEISDILAEACSITELVKREDNQAISFTGEDMGGDITLLNERCEAGEKIADILVRTSSLHGITIEGDIIPTLIDEIPIIAVMAAVADGTTVIKDAAELKVKETDRIETVTDNLKAMGCNVTPTEDGMIITGGTLHGASIHTLLDHRIAMAFSIAALVADGTTKILDSKCVDVSYPTFYDTFEQLL